MRLNADFVCGDKLNRESKLDRLMPRLALCRETEFISLFLSLSQNFHWVWANFPAQVSWKWKQLCIELISSRTISRNKGSLMSVLLLLVHCSVWWMLILSSKLLKLFPNLKSRFSISIQTKCDLLCLDLKVWKMKLLLSYIIDLPSSCRLKRAWLRNYNSSAPALLLIEARLQEASTRKFMLIEFTCIGRILLTHNVLSIATMFETMAEEKAEGAAATCGTWIHRLRPFECGTSWACSLLFRVPLARTQQAAIKA